MLARLNSHQKNNKNKTEINKKYVLNKLLLVSMNANNAKKENKINDLYENVGYFSSYGGSVLSFLFITFFVFFIC